ncbi:MAG TPA: phytoene/squalene synthase family protein [Phycisphaerales bacterium]|nr:phytoene/squalene synthase family protein [Phycisphaerales bacterium]
MTLAGAISADLQASLDDCGVVVRTQARNFWWGLRVSPRPQRDVLYAVYAWMRLGDDIVDESRSREEAVRAFEEFKRLSERAMAGEATGQGCWPAFAWAVAQAGVPHVWLRDMLAGLAWDLEHAAFERDEQLERYCYLVGGTVGLVCTHVWGLRSGVVREDALAKADARGRSFQMINIARDIATDARASSPRGYVPAELLARHGVSREELLAWRDARGCEAVVRELLARADAYYARSAGLEAMIDPRFVPVLEAMTSVYQGVLRELKARPERSVLGPRARVAGWRKAMIGVRAVLQQWGVR